MRVTVALLAVALSASVGLRTGARTPGGLDAYVASEMAAQHIPAISYAVVRDGSVIASGARGLANVELNAPASNLTEFAIASMSKSVTASAIMLLAQDGALSIDDRVGKYLSPLPDTWKDMTIRHLLTHTSGVKDHFQDSPLYPPLGLDRRLSYSPEDYLRAHIDAPLNFPPGTQWSYSGGGYVILGGIIQRITGHPYGDFLRDRIFRPLGMQHTHIISVSDVMPNRASGYWFRDGALRNGGYTGQAHVSGPDVGVMTTATDFARWIIAVSSGHLWTAASRDAMWTPAKLDDGREAAGFPTGSSYGLGWRVQMYRRYEGVGHGGSLVNGFTSAFVVIPAKRFAVVVLTNQYDARPEIIGFGIAGRIDPDLTPPGELAVQPDVDPAATARAKAFTSALLLGGDLTRLATAGLARHLSTMGRPPGTPPGPPPTVTLVRREDLQAPLQRFGAEVVRLGYYKVELGDEAHWLTLYLTTDGRVADVSGY